VGPVDPELVKGLLDPKMRAIARITVGSVDAVVELPEKTILIEAMIREDFGKIQMLKTYRHLYRTDPTYRDRWELPIELIILTPIYNPLLEHFCREEGIRYIHYRPQWIEPYLGSLAPRHRTPRLKGVKQPEET